MTRAIFFYIQVCVIVKTLRWHFTTFYKHTYFLIFSWDFSLTFLKGKLKWMLHYFSMQIHCWLPVILQWSMKYTNYDNWIISLLVLVMIRWYKWDSVTSDFSKVEYLYYGLYKPPAKKKRKKSQVSKDGTNSEHFTWYHWTSILYRLSP